MEYTKKQYTNKIKSGSVSADEADEVQSGKDAKISWEGDSLAVIRGFPEGPRGNLGHCLRLVQQGVLPPDASPVPGLEGVFELRDQDERAWYRVPYLKKIGDTVYVLHCFEKRSNRIEKRDINTAETRLKRVRARLAEETRHAKRQGRKSTRHDRERS